jgi:hypothetical protein
MGRVGMEGCGKKKGENGEKGCIGRGEDNGS